MCIVRWRGHYSRLTSSSTYFKPHDLSAFSSNRKQPGLSKSVKLKRACWVGQGVTKQQYSWLSESGCRKCLHTKGMVLTPTPQALQTQGEVLLTERAVSKLLKGIGTSYPKICHFDIELFWAEVIWVPGIPYLHKIWASQQNSVVINLLPRSNSNLIREDWATPRQTLSQRIVSPIYFPKGWLIFPKSHLHFHKCPFASSTPPTKFNTETPSSNQPIEVLITG